MNMNVPSPVARRPSLSRFYMLATLMATLFGSWVPPAGAQWNVTFLVDEQQATTALGAERVAPMQQALARVKSRLDQILSSSTGSSIISIDWTAPPTALADATSSFFHVTSIATAKTKLINQATADSESLAEILMYESLPPTTVPFRYDSTTVLSVGFVAIPNSLNKHLAFQPTTEQNDGTIRFTPPSLTTKWQFWRTNKNLVGYEVFECVAMHEVLHLLGFRSSAESIIAPNSLDCWDLFRFGDAAVPVSAAQFTTLARELRPTEEATAVTQLGTTTGAYKLSRGTRTGGDSFQASHWRKISRLTPPTAIGVMHPDPSANLYSSLGRKFITRADVEALDVMGWNVNPAAIQFTDAGSVNLVVPAASAQFAAGEPITFEWEAGDFLDWDVYVHSGTEIVDDDPVRVFYQLPSTTLTATLEGATALPPGEYVWVVVGGTFAGTGISAERRFTITPSCDADVNCDFALDGFDVESQERAVSGDMTDYCLPDPDFNGDFALDGFDVEAVELVVGGGPCP